MKLLATTARHRTEAAITVVAAATPQEKAILQRAAELTRRSSPFIAIGVLLGLTSACTIDSTASRYLLAEHFWSDGKYLAAVNEFDKVSNRDPHSKLGRQALYRSAMTESLYLSNYSEAVRKFRSYIDGSGNTPLSWEAEKQIGEIYFSKLEMYDRAIAHYKRLLAMQPKSPEAPEFLFRIGRSYFFLRKFEDAIVTYREVSSKFPKTKWAENAAFEVAVCYYTEGGQHVATKNNREGASESSVADTYQEAIDSYERFIKRFPRSPLVPQARFGIAASLEELDQLENAYHQFEALKATYPSPQVIEIRLARIRERREQKSR